jgi:hypothetical protein
MVLRRRSRWRSPPDGVMLPCIRMSVPYEHREPYPGRARTRAVWHWPTAAAFPARRRRREDPAAMTAPRL